ncbi:MAG: PD40 domain-containing protein [Elusimicrobia bacterium]|nr:PD40 domain-containing protein [Elusimicrobiota bacterium]
MIFKNRLLKICAAAVCLAAAASTLNAFGRNKVITRPPRWRVVSTPHFDLHYTPDAEGIVPRAAHFLEEAYGRVTRAMDTEVKGRTSFFLFPNHNRFEENNIADVDEGTGGVTEAFKNRFIVFNNGTEHWLEHVIIHEFTHVVQFEVLYGGFWKSARLLKSPLYPLWFMEGLAEYSTGDLDEVEEDLYLRDAATSDRLYPLMELHGFSHLRPHEVTLGYKEGCAAVHFLAEQYGVDKVSDLLKMLRDRFEVPSILADLAGQDFRQFDRRFREHLTEYYRVQTEGAEEPEAYGRRLTRSDLLPVFNTHPALSPDGRWVAYFSDKNGQPELALYDFRSGEHRILIGPPGRRIENIHTEGRALSFSPDGRWVAFTGEKEQKDYLYLYDVPRRRLRRINVPFDQVRSPVFHPTEPRLAVVGMQGGSNDLYEISPRGKRLRRLTDSPADENDPAYSPDGKTLVYSQEFADEPLPRHRPERNLVALNLTSLATTVLTDLPNNEGSPVFTPDGNSLLFIGNADGVPNLYRLDVAEGRAVQLTRVIGGIFSPAFSKEGNALVFSSFRRGSQNVYLAKPSLWKEPPPAAPALALQPSRFYGAAGSSPETAHPPSPAPPSPWESPLFSSARRPYRFRASTDLFFPFLYYSSTDGLFLATLWQASEYLGNHQLGASMQYSSGNDFLDYQVQYQYRRFRPQFFMEAGGLSYFRDFSKTELRRESETLLGVAYPFDRYHRVEGVLGSLVREDHYDRFPQFNELERENIWSLSLLRDATLGRYLAVTSGNRFRATYQVARPVFGGNRSYRSHAFELHQFVPTGRESVMAFRGMTGVSSGDEPQLFRLGGADRIRGYARRLEANQASRFVMGNLEWRVPLKYTNFTGFIFPDINIKAVYGVVFMDAGYDWTRSQDLERLSVTNVRHSVGAGVRLPTFILQTFPLTLSVDVAKRTDAHNWTWYFSLGPEF